MTQAFSRGAFCFSFLFRLVQARCRQVVLFFSVSCRLGAGREWVIWYWYRFLPTWCHEVSPTVLCTTLDHSVISGWTLGSIQNGKYVSGQSVTYETKSSVDEAFLLLISPFFPWCVVWLVIHFDCGQSRRLSWAAAAQSPRSELRSFGGQSSDDWYVLKVQPSWLAERCTGWLW